MVKKWEDIRKTTPKRLAEMRSQIQQEHSIKTDYTRKELIRLCVQAIVTEDKWSDRDSCGAQVNVGKAWALLRANVPFRIEDKGNMATDRNTIWVAFDTMGFGYFEDPDNNGRGSEFCYIPTEKRLSVNSGGDWY